jgi:hypothetical protein
MSMLSMFERKPKFLLGHGKVVCISGCQDDQTAGDALDVLKFFDIGKLLQGPQSQTSAAGGACTTAMMDIMYHPGGAGDPAAYKENLAGFLSSLRKKLADAKNKDGKQVFTQIPQLSSTHQLDLSENFLQLIKNPAAKRTKALLIGIAYDNKSSIHLNGSHNDVKKQKQLILTLGFTDTPETMKVLLDDGDKATLDPTKKNIENSLKWLVQDAAPGDSLFLHYSGHGDEVRTLSRHEMRAKGCAGQRLLFYFLLSRVVCLCKHKRKSGLRPI